MVLKLKAWEEVTGKGAAARPPKPNGSHCEGLGSTESQTASQPSWLQRGRGRVETAAPVWGCWGRGESLSTCEMAHWAAAIAVLATEAALMRLPSLEAMSLGRMSETRSQMEAPGWGASWEGTQVGS